MGCFGGSDPKKPEYIAAQLEKLSLPDRLKAIDEFIAQKDKFGGIQDTLEASASGYMDSLDALNPGYKAGFQKSQQVADSLIQGLMPDDISSKVSRTAAFKGLTAGLGANQRSQLEARDMARTSFDLTGQGLTMQQGLRQETRGLMPLQSMNLAFTPQNIRQEDVGLAQYNNNITNRQAELNANVYNRQQDADYAYESQYNGSPLAGIAGSVLGAGLGFLAAPATGGMSIPLGMSMGGAIGGQFGGARGMQAGAAGMSLGNMGIAGISSYNQGAYNQGRNQMFGNYRGPFIWDY
jgi:hypothetical protein